jgi:lysophospholipid acyltransferase (LPLAT)-like uncharacterized protein
VSVTVAEQPAAGLTREEAARERKLVWTVRIGVLAIRMLATTWRMRVRHDDAYRALVASGRPFIYSLWHGQVLPLLWHHRDTGATILISEHRDGEIIARVAHALGYRTVRGSTTRGGGRALLALVKELNAGLTIAVTPDGPKGPALTYAPGALVASQRSGAPIMPVVASARRAWHLKSWDRFMIPKPFTRVTVAYGEPTNVIGATPREAAEEGARFERLMNAAMAHAEA